MHRTIMDTVVHGTYPWDDGRRWAVLEREMPLERARTVLGLPEDAPNERGYMWLNKGFIVVRLVGQPMPHPARGWLEAGDRAVYLADGTYYLLEWQEKPEAV